MFPVADETVKISGGDQRLRTSTLVRIVQNEERNKFFEENQTNSLLQLHFKMTTLEDAETKRMIPSLLHEISFVVITWNPESNCTCREKIHFLFR